MITVLENDLLKIEVSDHGAELQSLVRKDNGVSYLWYGDAAFWGRRSPVLFPFVGACRDKKYRVDDTEYPMGQHGFARDKEFTLIEKTEDTLWYQLTEDEETLKVYPFRFVLKLGYKLEKEALRVLWTVENPAETPLYFGIGGHPAFLCPPDGKGGQTSCSITLQDPEGKPVNKLLSRCISDDGLVTHQMRGVLSTGGKLDIYDGLFDRDALVMENRQLARVGLADSTGHEFLAVEFDAPLVGVWSPAKKDCPFVCIEPWYGRCDSVDFFGKINQKQFENTLKAGEVFNASYRILPE